MQWSTLTFVYTLYVFIPWASPLHPPLRPPWSPKESGTPIIEEITDIIEFPSRSVIKLPTASMIPRLGRLGYSKHSWQLRMKFSQISIESVHFPTKRGESPSVCWPWIYNDWLPRQGFRLGVNSSLLKLATGTLIFLTAVAIEVNKCYRLWRCC